jgi:beta-lactamase superfamily II metal-dependent hydrolase
MSIVKSFSVGNGDMFYIKHNNDNFTVIDCCYDSIECWAAQISEIKENSKYKKITRFISTHPDDDHIKGLCDYVREIGIVNFYCVKNEANKKDPTDDFEKYCTLRDDSNKVFYLYEGCTRKWMNISDEKRKHAGLHCLWPNTKNEDYKEALKKAKGGSSPNNISPVMTYTVSDFKFMWMGDIEAAFLDKIKDSINFPAVDVLFAPHHGRDSGKLPEELIKKIHPRIIVIGEASSKNLNYYSNYYTITQNSSGDISFDITDNKLEVFVEKYSYACRKAKNPVWSNSINGYSLGYLKSKSKSK